jgi:hypothetical protein
MLRFRADGDLASMDARVFLDVVQELLTTARSIDAAAADDARASVWRLAALEEGSAVVATRAESGSATEELVLREFELVTTSAVAESLVPASRLRALIKTQAKALAAGLGTISVDRGNERAASLDDNAVRVMQLRLDSMVESIGSVTGTVVTLRVPDDNQWYLSVKDRRTGRNVRCYLPRDEELLQHAREAVHRMARVRGRVARQGLRGRIQEVRQVRAVDVLPTDGDITMGFGHGPTSSAEETVREQRG